MSDTVLLTGATGFLGHYLVSEAGRRGLRVSRAGRVPADCDVVVDLADPATFEAAVAAVQPRFVINAAAMASIAQCQARPTVALKVNGKSPRALASTCGCRFLQLSTDMVFSGDAAPYHASAVAQPLSVYGMSKAEGEKLEGDNWLVVRLPLLFGRSFDGRRGASDMLRNGIGAKERLCLFSDEFRTPLHVADAARGIFDLLLDEEVRGIRHLGGHERLSRWELAQRFCAASEIPTDTFVAGTSEDPRRPKDVSLVGDWQPDRDLDAALRDC